MHDVRVVGPEYRACLGVVSFQSAQDVYRHVPVSGVADRRFPAGIEVDSLQQLMRGLPGRFIGRGSKSRPEKGSVQLKHGDYFYEELARRHIRP